MNKNALNKILFSAVIVLYWFSLYTYVPILAPFAESIGASHKVVGLILGSYGFTQVLLRLPLGILSDALGRRKIFVISGLLFSLSSSLGMWYYSSPLMLLIFRGLAGVAATTWVCYTVLFSRFFAEQDSVKAIGYINALNFLGQLTALLAGGTIAQYFGQRATFIIGACAGAVGFLLGLAVTDNREISEQRITVKELLNVVIEKTLLSVSILAILVQFIIFSNTFGFTPAFAEKIGANDFQLGLLSAAFLLPGIITSALSSTVFERFLGERNCISSGFLALAVYSFATPFCTSMGGLMFTQAIGGLGWGLTFPRLMGLSIKTVEDNKRATAMGFFQGSYGLGIFIGPVLVGLISDSWGLKMGYLFAASLGVIGIICSRMMSEESSQTFREANSKNN